MAKRAHNKALRDGESCGWLNSEPTDKSNGHPGCITMRVLPDLPNDGLPVCMSTYKISSGGGNGLMEKGVGRWTEERSTGTLTH
ncbi:hypothetical protein EVAR_4390_1 [Eumeta japonica]|uniref:Uncharacterized protein n=1 Tax=Eumeta variegata TaxID=151549 RepID=A0A4C1T0H8_EUMVA|nr:hypothetical protein EVAR_4390_1 [Eumeta japonica]